MLAPVMKRKGKNVGTSYEEEGEKTGVNSYEGGGDDCWHQF